ncbi:hypothetical protein B7494_g4987 [Chlorociboria aeruginascens]|nr:hypothetical protein B7494_g4987 [Chlorociboria aeruginascens]
MTWYECGVKWMEKGKGHHDRLSGIHPIDKRPRDIASTRLVLRQLDGLRDEAMKALKGPEVTCSYGTPEGLSGFPEVMGNSSGLPSPPSSPPLAALTSANELALNCNSLKRCDTDGKKIDRKEGAVYTIREECERLFCETMKTVFFGEEGNTAINGSVVMGTPNNAYSPPDDYKDVYSNFGNVKAAGKQPIDAWLEIWDYAGGCSFRGFVGGEGEKKSLFAFFDPSIIGQDLKQGLMALIELAEAVFAVSQVVICLDRSVLETEGKTLLKSLRWVGFELITFDMWSNILDTTSDRWLFLGMEV